MAYSRVRLTRVWRPLEYATTKEECTLEFKSCLESVAAPIAAPRHVLDPGIRTQRKRVYVGG